MGDRVTGKVIDRRIGGKSIGGDHRFPVMAHPVGMRVPPADINLPLHGFGQRRKFHHRVPGVLAVYRYVHLVGIDPRHHVGRRLAYRDIPHQAAGFSFENSQPAVKPLGLVDEILVPVGPHVVGIVHLYVRQGHFPRRQPGRCAHRRCRSGLFLSRGQLELRIDPHLPDPGGGGIEQRRKSKIISISRVQHRRQVDHGAAAYPHLDVGIGHMPRRRRGKVLPIRRVGRNEERSQ